MVRKRIHVGSEQPFQIHLAPGDHQLLAGEALTLDEKYTRRFRERDPGEAVTLTLDEIEDLMDHLAIEAGHTQDGNLSALGGVATRRRHLTSEDRVQVQGPGPPHSRSSEQARNSPLDSERELSMLENRVRAGGGASCLRAG